MSLYRIFTKILCAGLLASLMVLPAQATLFTGSDTGIWQNPTGTTTWTTGTGTSTISTGVGVDGGPNVLSYAGSPFTNIPDGTQFKIGTLTYTNTDTVIGTTMSGAQLKMTVTFTAPTGIPGQNFTYTFALNVTVNPAPDTLSFPTLPPPDTFLVGSNSYKFQMLGFSQNGGSTLINSITLAEDATTHADLYVKITPVNPLPGDVPEPATLSLTALGLGLAGFMRRRRASRVS